MIHMGSETMQRMLMGRHAYSWSSEFDRLIKRDLERVADRVFPLRRRAPHTDDMIQMCVDLGVEVVEPLEFTWVFK